MADQQKTAMQYFLQSVTINGVEMPRNWVTSALYIEKTSLTAPLLVLEVHDPAGKLVDEMGARPGRSDRAARRVQRDVFCDVRARQR